MADDVFDPDNLDIPVDDGDELVEAVNAAEVKTSSDDNQRQVDFLRKQKDQLESKPKVSSANQATPSGLPDSPPISKPSFVNRLFRSPEMEKEAIKPVSEVGKDAGKAAANAAGQAGKAAGQVGKTAGKVTAEGTKLVAKGAQVVGQAAARGAVALLENPYSLLIIGIIIAIVGVAVAIAIAVNGGSSPKEASAATTITQTLSNAGDLISRRQLDATSKQNVQTLITQLKTVATNNPPSGRPKPDQEAIDKLTDLSTRLETYSSNDSAVDQKVLTAMKDDINQLGNWGYNAVPASEIGKKIANSAFYYAGTAEGIKKYATCDINDKTACNSFAIRVMHETGADKNLTGTAYEQYLYVTQKTSCYEIIKVDFSRSEFYSQFSQGDLLYRSSKNKNGYGHVAIYVGNGQVAAASIGGHNPQISQNYNKALDIIARLKVASCEK